MSLVTLLSWKKRCRSIQRSLEIRQRKRVFHFNRLKDASDKWEKVETICWKSKVCKIGESNKVISKLCSVNRLRAFTGTRLSSHGFWGQIYLWYYRFEARRHSVRLCDWAQAWRGRKQHIAPFGICITNLHFPPLNYNIKSLNAL